PPGETPSPRGPVLDPTRGEHLDGVAQGLAEGRVLGLEADLGLLQGVDQPGLLFLVRAFELALDLAVEAGQLLPVLVAAGMANGSGDLVEQAAQVLFHSGNATGRGACT